MTPQAEATALAADTLYRERKLSVAAIAQKLHVSKISESDAPMEGTDRYW